MQQASLLPHEAQQLAMPDARVHFYPNWLTAAMASQYFETLNDELKWTQQDIVLFGKKYKSPRLQAWYGEPDAVYTYSGLKMTPLAWHETLADIRDECQQKLGVNFNSVLANLYRTGADSMGFHADDEPELGKAPIIASVSLGAMRNLDFVHNRTKQKVRVPLTHGSLLVMQGQTQMHWKHGINKTKRVTMPRINLTFRLVKT
ncbi:MAG: alpha-ketoglutarate-dependent dioxygenase AlkB [Pseudomonadota bacterium]